MSSVDVRLVSSASPARARSLLTVRAAISSAVSSSSPRSTRPSLMWSYWRSRLSLHARCGMPSPLLRSPGARWTGRRGRVAAVRSRTGRSRPDRGRAGGSTGILTGVEKLANRRRLGYLYFHQIGPDQDGFFRFWNEQLQPALADPVSYTHLRAHETVLDLVCR